MDLVSIIVPIYNAEKCLAECIESILYQSYKNIELILVNDGSADSSFDICEIYKKKDNRIVFLNKVNGGVSAARNYGLKNAKGKYICFVDADDTLNNKFVESMLNSVVAENIDVVFCNYMYDYNGKLIKKMPRINSGIYSFEEIKYKLIDDGTLSGILFGSVCGAIYKNSIIKGKGIKFHEAIRINEDGIFNIEYCMNSGKIRILSEDYLYMYRQIEKSASKAFSRENQTKLASQKIHDIFEGKEILENLKQQLGARKVSETFWMLLKLCSRNNSNNYGQIINDLKMLLIDQDFRDSLQYINKKETNKFKLMYYYLIKHKKYRTIYLTTRYIYPFLTNKISR